MTMCRAKRQMSASAERSGVGRGEAQPDPSSGEAMRPRHEAGSTGPGTSSLLTSTSRTARCGPACRVVWQGSDPFRFAPYADRIYLPEELRASANDLPFARLQSWQKGLEIFQNRLTTVCPGIDMVGVKSDAVL